MGGVEQTTGGACPIKLKKVGGALNQLLKGDALNKHKERGCSTQSPGKGMN